ncbi:MAG: RIP metalloprotease RseP [Bdellovibrionales bacterium]|nr:RIP metalloprotease RseP [Bdellovibrionales bacterium]
MDIIINFITNVLSSVGPFILLLGILIFIHEFGHFIIAKYCGVKVEIFSLGFGKKILQYTAKSGTCYCISLIPLGGYVKMYGESPGVKIPKESQHLAFTHKNVYQRIAIVIAGPLMNLFLAAFIFSGLGYFGEQVPSSNLGDVVVKSEAYKAGFRSGDKILSLNQKKISNFLEINQYIEGRPNKKITALIKRNNSSKKEIVFTTIKIKNPNPVAEKEQIGFLSGIGYTSQSPIVWVQKSSPIFSLINSFDAKVDDGISAKKSDGISAKKNSHNIIKILSINKKPIKYLWELKQELVQAILSNKKTIVLQTGKSVSSFNIKLSPSPANIVINKISLLKHIRKKTNINKINTKNIFNLLKIKSCDLCLGLVKKDSPAHKAGLKATDRLFSINNKYLNHWGDTPKIIKSFKEGQRALLIKFIRNNKIQTTELTPKATKINLPTGEIETRFMVGIAPLIDLSIRFTPRKVTGLLNIINYGWSEAIKWTKLTMLSVARMFQNKVSSRNLAGVLSIGKMAKDSLDVGWYAFFRLMAIISINLFLLNLLPIPVLDGGHLLIYIIEVIRGGKKISLRKIEIAQGVGFILLISLMFYSLFNDIMRFL